MTLAQDIAEQAAGNWKKFNHFGWGSRPDDADQWCIVYVCSRISLERERSKHERVRKALDVPKYEGQWREERHRHWAVGYVQGFAVKVYDEEGHLTPAFKRLCRFRSLVKRFRQS